MTLLRYGEMRKQAFAPAFDLMLYGFSPGEACRVMKALGHPQLERGELLRRLRGLERPRKLHDGFTTSLSATEVRSLVLSLPRVLLERRKAIARELPAVMTDDDKADLDRKARELMRSAGLVSDRVRLLHVAGREWKENPNRLLQHEAGLEFC